MKGTSGVGLGVALDKCEQEYSQPDAICTDPICTHLYPTPSAPNLNVSRNDVTVTAKSLPEAAADIEEGGLSRVRLVGAGELTGAFREHGLITEYIVSVIPVILGAGVPLFSGKGSLKQPKLVDSRSYPNGIVQLRYLPG